jgi:hypothetical protein
MKGEQQIVTVGAKEEKVVVFDKRKSEVTFGRRDDCHQPRN